MQEKLMRRVLKSRCGHVVDVPLMYHILPQDLNSELLPWVGLKHAVHLVSFLTWFLNEVPPHHWRPSYLYASHMVCNLFFIFLVFPFCMSWDRLWHHFWLSGYLKFKKKIKKLGNILLLFSSHYKCVVRCFPILILLDEKSCVWVNLTSKQHHYIMMMLSCMKNTYWICSISH